MRPANESNLQRQLRMTKQKFERADSKLEGVRKMMKGEDSDASGYYYTSDEQIAEAMMKKYDDKREAYLNELERLERKEMEEKLKDSGASYKASLKSMLQTPPKTKGPGVVKLVNKK